ncbi:zinc finger and SCAN domain-containing protein 12-like [Macrobrachium nipponense]|uniref:zinc finger and SCAN domain-containing protein 12-like n=1 Tax=Macrobrachium nipponense TaxID=159736 RepID=UPI0030C7D619
MKRIPRSVRTFSQKTQVPSSHTRAHIVGNPLKCKCCGKEFSRKAHLESHMRIHTEEKPFKCSDCGKAFSHKNYLNIHMRVHTREKPFKCNYCGKAFSHRSIIYNHMRVHTREKPFKCKDCGKAFSQKINLEYHMSVHTGVKPLKCNDCGKAFSHKSFLKIHMRVHTGEKPFKCNDCGKAFSQRSIVYNHMRVHTKEKPFKCNDCGKAFSQKGHLVSHMKVHTGENPVTHNDCESQAGDVMKKKHSITLEQKMKIINLHAAGKAVATIARDEHLLQSTVSTIIKKNRSRPLEEMEQLLVAWMEDQIQNCIPLSLSTIQRKAHLFFKEIKKNYDDTYIKVFSASHGWFQRFKTRHNFHNVEISSEAAGTDVGGAAKIKDDLHNIINDEGYVPGQIFSVDKTGLYWKQMAEQSFGQRLDLNFEGEDIQEHIEVQDEEPTPEDLIELGEERKKAEEEEEIKEEPEQKFTTNTLGEAFASIEHGMKLFSKMDVNSERFAKVERGLQDVLAHYRVIYEEQKKFPVQVTGDGFLKTTLVPSPSTSEHQPSTSREITAENEQIDEPAALSWSSSSSDIY